MIRLAFVDQVREELARLPLATGESPGCAGCLRAELAGLALGNGGFRLTPAGMGLQVRAYRAVVARRLTRVWRALGQPPVKLQIQRDRRRPGGYMYSLWLPAAAATTGTATTPRVAEAGSGSSFLRQLGLEQRHWGVAGRRSWLLPAQGTLSPVCCGRSFLRGLFLSRGTMADPARLYQVELSVSHTAALRLCVAQLRRYRLRPKSRHRPGGWVVYLQGAEPVVAFLGLVGATSSMMGLENQRVMRQIKGDVNRLVNSETANVRKTVRASWRLQRQIQWLVEQIGWERMPPGLALAAQLRLAHPELTLAELGRLVSPPLSKSAINHRLRRLAQLAQANGYQSRDETDAD